LASFHIKDEEGDNLIWALMSRLNLSAQGGGVDDFTFMTGFHKQ